MSDPTTNVPLKFGEWYSVTFGRYENYMMPIFVEHARAAWNTATAAKDAELMALRAENERLREKAVGAHKCEACGCPNAHEGYKYVRTLNGGLNLCLMCLANINGKNPELKTVRAERNRLRALADELTGKLMVALPLSCQEILARHAELTRTETQS